MRRCVLTAASGPWLVGLMLLGGCDEQPATMTPEEVASASAPSSPASGSASLAVAPPPGSSVPLAADGTQGPSPTSVAERAAPEASVEEPTSAKVASQKSARDGHDADEDGKPAVGDGVRTTAKGAGPEKKADTIGEVELIAGGSEPRRRLRFVPAASLGDQLEMTMTMAVAMKLGARSLPRTPLPPIVMKMSLDVDALRPDGGIRYLFDLIGADVRLPPDADPAAVAPLKKALGRMKDVNGWARMNDRGINQEASVNLPADLDARSKQVMQGMEQAMQQIGAPLPVEEVGVGAKWRHRTNMEQGGVRLSQVATYELLKLAGSTVHCKIDITQTAPPQTITAPGGVKTQLTGLRSSGSGKMELRLDHLAPKSSLVKMNTSVQMRAKDKRMAVETDMTIELRSP